MTTLAMARHLGRRLGRGLVHLLACGLLPTALHAATPAVALYYGNALPLSDFRAFDIVVVEPDHAALAALGQKVGVAGVHGAPTAIPLIARSSREARAFRPDDAAAPRLEVRAFAAPIGVPEDPVTGSLNASLAQWLIDAGELPARYVAAQGAALGRAGRVHVQRDAQGQVWVGGDCVAVIGGEVRL